MLCNSWTTRVAPQKNAHGSPIIYIQDGESRTSPQVVLSRTECNTVAFNPDFEKKDIAVAISVEPQQLEYLESVDKWALQQALEHSQEWFGKTYTESELKLMYNPCLKTHELYPPKFKARITPRTRITVDGREVKFDDANTVIFRGCAVRVSVAFSRIWVVGGKFGVICYYTNLALNKPEYRYPAVDFPEL